MADRLERRKLVRLFGLVLCIAGCSRGGVETVPFEAYQPQSEFLLEPERNIALVVDTVTFLERGRDDVNGGFHVYVDTNGDPTLPDYSWWGRTECDVTFDYILRPVHTQSRVAFAFAKAFMLTGDVAYLEHAEHALEFMYDHGRDRLNGGWHFTTDERGDLAPWQPCKGWNPNRWKWSFAQFYPLLGIRALTEATLGASEGGRRTEHWRELAIGLDVLDQQMWDDREGFQGYYDETDLDWTFPRGKGFTGPADGMATHVASMYLQTGTSRFRQRMLTLADNLAEQLVPTIERGETRFGFAESFDVNWMIDRDRTDGFVGHMMKAAWCLARAYKVDPKPAYKEAGQAIFDEVWNNGGYDHTNGGVYSAFDWREGDVDTTKNHWNLEQGLTGGLTNYHLAEDEEVRSNMLQMADGSLGFFMTHLVDPMNGVAISDTNRRGQPLDSRKGHIWKAGFHDTELGYLAYVYGSLYYTGEPITLYYFAENDGTDHTMVLNPVEDDALRITGVTLDGAPYQSFDGDTRELRVPAGVGGVFSVTFELPGG